MDITKFMTWFIGQMLSLVTWVFSTLDSITFLGTSLLKYSIGILITGVILNVMLSLVKSQGMKELSHRVEKHKETTKKEQSQRSRESGEKK